MLEFVWPEEVALKVAGFGSLAGTTYTLWCGGSLIFDTNGNVLHYALADGGPARRKGLLSYLRYLVDEGSIGGEDELRSRRIRATVADGRLQLARNAALRHEGRWCRKQ